MIKICIINYFQGNINSIYNCISNISNKFELKISNSIYELKKSDIIILPGVGRFITGVNALKKLKIYDYLKNLPSDKLLIGICLGMQLLTEESEEDPGVEGLSLIKAKTKILSKKKLHKMPVIGFNEIKVTKNQKLFNEFNKKKMFFTHSYFVDINKSDLKNTLFKTTYSDQEFCSGFIKKNIIGLQFHPELSRNNGVLLYKKILNFKK